MRTKTHHQNKAKRQIRSDQILKVRVADICCLNVYFQHVPALNPLRSPAALSQVSHVLFTLKSKMVAYSYLTFPHRLPFPLHSITLQPLIAHSVYIFHRAL